MERLRIISWCRGRSADSRASRTVAWDSSLCANASKVLSTRALLPIAPRRHSAASTLSNSGEYILSTWPLLRLVRGWCMRRFYRRRSNAIAAASALLKSSLSERHSFLGERAPSAAYGRQSRVLPSRLVRLLSEFVRGVAAERYRLAQVVHGQCPVVERPRSCWIFHRCV